MMNAGGTHAAVPELSRDELRARLANGEPFKLVMAASDFGFRAKHIPGSIHLNTSGAHRARADRLSGLEKNDEIVVYCSNIDCHASLAAISELRDHGYDNVKHYAGGLVDWEAAGLPVEGDWASGPAS